MSNGRTLSPRPRPQGQASSAAQPRQSGSLQDAFLNLLRRNKTPVTMFLVKGVMLQGRIAAFDLFCVLLERDGAVQLAYKHAVSTIQPASPVDLTEDDEDDDGPEDEPDDDDGFEDDEEA
ncbi:RNA-binding protein Hfq [Erythrobacter litoralis]|nr:RNA-binding protein Hfq [Erythrobacter litoralis]